MSGGVDSSVAAWLLKKKGYEVIGLTALLYQNTGWEGERSCCGIKATDDARAVAQKLGVPHYAVNLKEMFAKTVIADFCAAYRSAITPNPCILCNQTIKWGALLAKARQLGAYYLATGHYAHCQYDKKSHKYLLLKGRDTAKDQSYFLYTLTQPELSRTIFPLGDLTKKQVRELARQAGLPVAEKKESQEICFVPDNDYPKFLRRIMPEAFQPGPISDSQGRALGRHQGLPAYTIGQRRGLGIGHHEPLYVLAIDRQNNSLIVGPEKDLYRRTLLIKDIVLTDQTKPSPPVLPGRLTRAAALKARIRYQAPEARVKIAKQAGGRNVLKLTFSKPQRAVTPGQAVVFYDKDRVLGGGTILE